MTVKRNIGVFLFTLTLMLGGVITGFIQTPHAQSTTILDMARATFRGDAGPGGNELFLDARVGTDDPTKFRQGNPTRSLIFGASSYDFLKDGRRLEKVLVSGAPDDSEAVRHWIAEDKPGGVYSVGVQVAGTEDDAGMIKAIRVSARELEIFGRKVALRGANGDFTWLMGTGNQPDRMVDPSGRFVTIQQGDGNFVTYDANLGPIGSPEAAIWSAWAGKIQ